MIRNRDLFSKKDVIMPGMKKKKITKVDVMVEYTGGIQQALLDHEEM